jgi:glycine dehydrogenase
MVCDLTGLPVANASLLDEATAAAEAMHMALALKKDAKAIFVSAQCHPQTIAVIETRAEPLGVKVIVADDFDFSQPVCAVVVQYPDTLGSIRDYSEFFAKAHTAGAVTICRRGSARARALASAREFGADIAIGSTQRFGVPLGFGGPHAAYSLVRMS